MRCTEGERSAALQHAAARVDRVAALGYAAMRDSCSVTVGILSQSIYQQVKSFMYQYGASEHLYSRGCLLARVVWRFAHPPTGAECMLGGAWCARLDTVYALLERQNDPRPIMHVAMQPGNRAPHTSKKCLSSAG